MTWGMQITRHIFSWFHQIAFTSLSHSNTWTLWLILNNYCGFKTIIDAFKWNVILSDQYHWSLSVIVLIALSTSACVHAHTHTHLTCTHSESLPVLHWNTESVCRIQMLNIVPTGSEFCTFMWRVLGKLTPYSLCFVMKHGFITGDMQIISVTRTDV